MRNRTVFVSGIFNVLHPGHLRLLRFARDFGERLIVGVISDHISGGASHVHEDLRYDGILCNSWVDYVFMLDEPVEELLGCLRPDTVVKGKEHECSINPERDVIDSYGGKLIFSSGESNFSSLDLLRKEFYEFSLSSISKPNSYLARHNIDVYRIEELLNKFKCLRVAVIGDLIVDEYITCEPLGMSQEDPTIVVTPVDSTKFIGGAAIVAAHAAGLGATVDFISVVGVDANGEYTKTKLEKFGVDSVLIKDESRPTTLKQRFRSKGKSLLRVSHLHQTAISSQLQYEIFEQIKSKIDAIDLLVFSDFNYGCLPQCLVDMIIDLANKNGVKMAADSQSSSQIGNISRFKGMDLITPTEREARISARNYEDGLVVLADDLMRSAQARYVLLKLGEEGLLIHTVNEEAKYGDWTTDRVSALNSAPRDVSGAGDSLLIATALSIVSGGSIWESSYVGALAAAVQVGRVGNSPIQFQEILQELNL